MNLWYLATMLGSCAGEDLSVPTARSADTTTANRNLDELEDHISREERGI